MTPPSPRRTFFKKTSKFEETVTPKVDAKSLKSIFGGWTFLFCDTDTCFKQLDKKALTALVYGFHDPGCIWRHQGTDQRKMGVKSLKTSCSGRMLVIPHIPGQM